MGSIKKISGPISVFLYERPLGFGWLLLFVTVQFGLIQVDILIAVLGTSL